MKLSVPQMTWVCSRSAMAAIAGSGSISAKYQDGDDERVVVVQGLRPFPRGGPWRRARPGGMGIAVSLTAVLGCQIPFAISERALTSLDLDAKAAHAQQPEGEVQIPGTGGLASTQSR